VINAWDFHESVRIGDLILIHRPQCRRCREDLGEQLPTAQVVEIRKTSYGWARLVLLCGCGYYYESSTLQTQGEIIGRAQPTLEDNERAQAQDAICVGSLD